MGPEGPRCHRAPSRSVRWYAEQGNALRCPKESDDAPRVLYPWLKTAHVLLAIVAVGFSFSYAILIRRAAREPVHFGHVLRTVKFLDDRFATPAYLLLPVLGLAMVAIGGWDIATLWILASLGLYVVLVFVGAAPLQPDAARPDRGPRRVRRDVGRVPPAHREGMRSARCSG